jgi:predicted CopG family antitoxin
MTKQIGIFKPKKMRLVKPIQKKRRIAISSSLHEILSCEKTRRESFNDCISRIIKERAALRVEINQML